MLLLIVSFLSLGVLMAGLSEKREKIIDDLDKTKLKNDGLFTTGLKSRCKHKWYLDDVEYITGFDLYKCENCLGETMQPSVY